MAPEKNRGKSVWHEDFEDIRSHSREPRNTGRTAPREYRAPPEPAIQGLGPSRLGSVFPEPHGPDGLSRAQAHRSRRA